MGFAPGPGGGGGSIAGASDVSLSSVQNSQVLTYESSSSKWQNQDAQNTAGATNLSVTPAPANLTVVSSTGDDAVLPSATTALAGVLSSADKTKLDSVAVAATANSSDAQLRDRSTHTGLQALSTVDGLEDELGSKAATSLLDTKADLEGGKVLESQLPEWATLIKWQGVIQQGQTPTGPTGWYIEFLDSVVEAQALYQNSSVSTTDINGNLGAPLIQTAEVGDVILVSVHGGSNTTTLGANASGVASWVAGTQANTTDTSPHMCARIMVGQVTTQMTAGSMVNGSRDSNGSLVVHVVLLKATGSTHAAQAVGSNLGSTTNNVIFQSLAAPANSYVFRALTTQDNVDITSSGPGGGLTMIANRLSTGGSQPRRGMLLMQEVTDAANVTGQVPLSNQTKVAHTGSALTKS